MSETTGIISNEDFDIIEFKGRIRSLEKIATSLDEENKSLKSQLSNRDKEIKELKDELGNLEEDYYEYHHYVGTFFPNKDNPKFFAQAGHDISHPDDLVMKEHFHELLEDYDRFEITVLDAFSESGQKYIYLDNFEVVHEFNTKEEALASLQSKEGEE